MKLTTEELQKNKGGLEEKKKELKKNKKDYLLKFLTLLITFSATSTEAILIVTGMENLMEGWRIFRKRNKKRAKRTKKIISSSAAALGVAVEGTVYEENIKGAFTTLFTKKSLQHHTVRSLLIEEYNNYQKIKPLLEKEDDFLESYAKLYRLLSLGMKIEEHDHTQEFAKKMLLIKLNLCYLEKQVIHYCQEKKGKEEPHKTLSLTTNFESRYNKKICSKKIQLGTLLSFALISIPSLLPVNFYYATQLFLFFGAIGFAVTIGIYVCTFLAIISSLLMTYFTLEKIVQEDIFKKFFSTYKNSISHHYKERNWPQLIFIALATLILIASVIILLLSTFGTYSQSGITGFTMLFHSSIFLAKTITMPFCIISTLIDALFSFTNIGETLHEYSHFFSARKIANGILYQFNKLFVTPFKDFYLTNTSLYQRSWAIAKIPVAIITLIPYVYNIVTEGLLGIAMFMGHVISEAAPMDKPLWISKYPAVINNGFYEFGCGHCVAPHKEETEEEKVRLIKENTPLKPLEYEGHSHSKNIFTFIQLPFHYLNAALYFFFSGLSWKTCKKNKITPHWGGHHHEQENKSFKLFMEKKLPTLPKNMKQREGRKDEAEESLKIKNTHSFSETRPCEQNNDTNSQIISSEVLFC